MTYHTDALHIDISVLVAAAQKKLIESVPLPIKYMDMTCLENNKLPPAIKISPINIYALWMRAKSSENWELMYIGQRSYEFGWSRVEQHLFSTPQGTQSKLQKVRNAIKAGAEMGVTGILIKPNSLRLSVEDELIKLNSLSNNHLIWNRKGRAKVSKY